MTGRFTGRARKGDDHLASAGHYRNDAGFQKDLDNFFIRTRGQPALERLAELNEDFGIGGAVPYITIREATGGRQERMIVVRHSLNDRTVSTEIRAGTITRGEAEKHPDAQAVLARFAEDRLFELQIQNAPATVTYSAVITRYLATLDPSSADAETNRLRREKNKSRNVRDPAELFNAMKARGKVLISELFKDRELRRPPTRIPSEIKTFLVRRALNEGATMDKHGQVAGALDGNVAAYASVVRQSLNWVRDTYHPSISLPIESFKPRTTRSPALKWSECRNVMLWSQGYVFENGGFARHWVERDGKLRLGYKKLPEERLAKHRAEFLPLLRFIPSLAMTGSRIKVGSLLCWSEDDYFGYVELNGARSKIHRTGILGPNYVNKPRATSALTPLARRFFEVCFAKDQRDAMKHGWSANCVFHNGRGGAVPDLAALFKKACVALGIKNSARKLKHLAVTVHWFAGFELRRIALIVGTDPKTTEDHYLYLEDEYPGLVRPRPDPQNMTFVDLADPQRDIAKIPRAPAPPRPVAADRAPHLPREIEIA